MNHATRVSPRPISVLLLVCFAIVWCDRVDAVVITLQDGTRIGGWIIAKDQDTVVVDVINKSGDRVRRTLEREDVDDVSYAISASRLAELNPSKPVAYKRYAEELAQVTIDPEARPMSLRLYHIALTLDPDNLRDSCLLGMVAIARNRDEERRFRAAAFLHRTDRDDSVIANPLENPSADDDTKKQNILLQLLRDLRMRKRLIVRATELPLLRETLSPYTDTLTDEEISKLFVIDCNQCKNGIADCPYCERGVIVSGNRRTLCRQCKRGQIACKSCNDGSSKRALPDDLMMRIVTAEIQILNSMLGETQTTATTGDDEFVSWSQLKPTARKRTIPALSLRNLTEFDPTKCVFRGDKWIVPKSE